MRQHFGGELGARTDADDVGFGDARFQFVLGQRLGMRLDLRIAGCMEGVDGGLADAFQQQDADVLLGVRGLLLRHAGRRDAEWRDGHYARWGGGLLRCGR